MFAIKEIPTWIILRIYTLFYKQRCFPTQPQCCLTSLWIEFQMLLRCCLIHITIIIILSHILHLICLFMSYTAWKLSKYELILVRIFPYSDWIRRYLSVFSPNARNDGQEKTPYLDTFHSVVPCNYFSFSAQISLSLII